MRVLIHTTVLSVASGLAAVAFFSLTNLLFSKTYIAFSGRSKPFFIIASFLLIMCSSLLVVMPYRPKNERQ